jgi:LPXTG-motif cell wall-anchored protein
MPGSDHLIPLAAPDVILTLAETGPESIGYIIIVIGLVGLGLALTMLAVVSRHRRDSSRR